MGSKTETKPREEKDWHLRERQRERAETSDCEHRPDRSRSFGASAGHGCGSHTPPFYTKKDLMSNIEDNKEQGQMDIDASDGSNNMPSSQKQEETIKKKYGGMMPKKPPLISKDHERAYFDSADWALGKQGGEKPKGPLEALRPKLQPTQQQTRYRKSPYAPSGEEGGSVPSGDAPSNE